MQRDSMIQSSWVGVDFGTTNSAVAFVDGSGIAQLAQFAGPAGPRPTFPSVLYFEPKKPSVAGADAIERYIASEIKGRFIQSLKAYLADRSFEGTGIGTQHYTLEKLIALIGKHMGEQIGFASWPRPRRIILGRPVHFSNPPDPELDAFATDRLLAAIPLPRRPPPRSSAGRDPPRRLRRHRLRVRAGGGSLRLRDAAAAGRADPDRRLRWRDQRLHDHFGWSGRAPPRPARVGHHRHRRRADCRRRIRQADHPQPGGAAPWHGRRISLAAAQVPAGPELAVRAAGALALPVVPEVAVDARDARAHQAHRFDPRTARRLPAADQERARLPAARGGAAHQIRAVDRRRGRVRLRIGTGHDPQESDARGFR